MSEELKEVEVKEENKAVIFKIEEGKLIILVDPNKDGEAVLDLVLDLKEVPDEILSLFRKNG